VQALLEGIDGAVVVIDAQALGADLAGDGRVYDGGARRGAAVGRVGRKGTS